MKRYAEIIQKIEPYHELGETIQAAEFLIEEYGIKHPNLKGFELREKAKPDYIMMTAEGNFGEKQIIRIPENTFSSMDCQRGRSSFSLFVSLWAIIS